MANDINTVVLSGNITREPEMRVNANGNAVLTFSLAVNESRKFSGGYENYSMFFPVAIFGKRAEPLANYLHKGTQLTISGKLDWKEWKTKDGERRTAISVIADNVKLPPRAATTPAEGTESAEGYADTYSEDIPF